MKKYFYLLFLLIISLRGFGQVLSWTPDFPKDNSTIVITADANKGNKGLLGHTGDVFVHVGVITNLSTGPGDWKYVKFTWGSTNAAAKAVSLGNNKWQYTITNPRSFFGVPAGETIQKITVIFRSSDGNLKLVNSNGEDMYIPVYGANEYAVKITEPFFEPRFIPFLEPLNNTAGSTVQVKGVASSASNLDISYQGNAVATAAGATTITTTINLATACDQRIILTGNNGTVTDKDTVAFYIAPVAASSPLPAGVVDGINYNANGTEVTLVLNAPGKTSAVVIGDFNNWQASCSYQMTKATDGKRFFLRLTGLTAGQLYKYQYVVDGNLTIADPYSELLLDPWNDQYISATTFPSLPGYPTGKTNGMVSTFQTNAPAYNWTSSNYTRPAQSTLIIYELLVRDFLAQSNWQTLADTLNYLKNLGVNAIEVMPFNEFDGNISWGYNPSFYFAPDKAYGTKNNLKRFIDMAHAKGMAVIMDAVWNHATGSNPWAQLWWNGAANKPAADNPYFNPDQKHPFGIFNDFNHESEDTKYAMARYIRHWLSEYRLDGFRWDLSKGFTQKNSSDVSGWNARDDSRIAIWKRYRDSVQAVSAGAYTILEHLGNNDEETILSNEGMMLWGNMNDNYAQNAMGYTDRSDLGWGYYKNRNWTNPNLITYAESHDEERIVYKMLAFGNASGSYNVKNLSTALQRAEAMYPMLLLIPGPKMIWQFGELGYDKSINTCENGTISNDCRVNPKPILWNYFTEEGRKRVYTTISKLNGLRALYPEAFSSATMTGNIGGTLAKHIIINHASVKIVALSNLDVTSQNIAVTMPATGTYTNYMTGEDVTINNQSYSEQLAPGTFKVYVYKASCTVPAAPAVSASVSYCLNQTTTALTATGTNLKWYDAATGGTALTTAPTPVSTSAGTKDYYVSQSSDCGESPRAKITVTITAAAPVAGLTVSNITANAAVANWITQPGNYYFIQYKKSSSNTWIPAATGVQSATVPLSGLDNQTAYDVRVSSNCTNLEGTNFVSASFTTIQGSNQVINYLSRNGIGLAVAPNPGTAQVAYYNLSETGNVSLGVFDGEGRQIQRMNIGNKTAGDHQYNVGTAMKSRSAGIYYLKLTVNNKSNTILFYNSN